MTQNLTAIPLPYPASEIDIDPSGSYAYISHSNTARVSVLDINPASSTYHTIVRDIDVTLADGKKLQGLAVTPDGSTLFVAAPGLNAKQDRGQLISIDLRTTNGKPAWKEIAPATTVGREPWTIARTGDDNTMSYVNRSQDKQAIGLIRKSAGTDTWIVETDTAIDLKLSDAPTSVRGGSSLQGKQLLL